MRSKSALIKCIRRLVPLGCLSLAALAQNAVTQNVHRVAPVPRDLLELATGQIQAANTDTSREAALQLLGRARSNFALRSTRQAYDLKVSFTVDTGGVTNYDGDWKMEDLFAPGQGHRWTATAASGYATTSVAANSEIYQEATASAVPLRLLEARGVLFDPLQSPAYAAKGTIRTATATFHGAGMTCLLLSRSRNEVNPASQRDWEETEECIDPQTGLLQMHSDAPGHYALYDYTNAQQFSGRILPRSVTITEGGRTVSKISVDSLHELTGADPNLFIPTEAMKAKGQAVALTSATKVTRIHLLGPAATAVTLRPVCVFGMMTPYGHLVEAHSLQPSDPNSQAAVEDASRMDFSPLVPAGAPPQQHFVFILEKFVSQQ